VGTTTIPPKEGLFAAHSAEAEAAMATVAPAATAGSCAAHVAMAVAGPGTAPAVTVGVPATQEARAVVVVAVTSTGPGGATPGGALMGCRGRSRDRPGNPGPGRPICPIDPRPARDRTPPADLTDG
jgi:hypothetical protein